MSQWRIQGGGGGQGASYTLSVAKSTQVAPLSRSPLCWAEISSSANQTKNGLIYNSKNINKPWIRPCHTNILHNCSGTYITLIKEPVMQNPFKLMYQVIKYAIKNKQPRCRSAFTYCEDDPPSRIDFGKNKINIMADHSQQSRLKTSKYFSDSYLSSSLVVHWWVLCW